MKNILVIAAHPDDETLGLGATLVKEIKNDSNVFVLTFADGESSRKKSSIAIKHRENQAKKACKILGIKKNVFLHYTDQLLEEITLLELAQKIEKRIFDWNIDTMFTHFWGDNNQDHRRLFHATMIACRQTPNSTISELLCYETPSSTEWGSTVFKPNLFIDVKNSIERKIEALKKYENEVLPYPHPRSTDAILNRSKYWGNMVGLEFAEPFIVIRKLS